MGPGARFHRGPSRSSVALVAAFTVWFGGCGVDASARDEWQGTVDTLSSGTILVRNPEAGIWDSAASWQLNEDLRIGSASGEGPDLFGAIRDLAVDADGRIYVLEAQANELRVFEGDGQHVRTIGREGGGPGEFRGPAGLAWGADGMLWVADPRNARYSLFDTTGTLVRSYHRPIGGVMLPWFGGVDTANRLYDYAFTRDGMAIVRFTSAGVSVETIEPVDTFSVPRIDTAELLIRDGKGELRASMAVPFSHEMVRHVDPRGHIWYGVNDHYRIIQRHLAGDTVRIIEREHTLLPVTEEEVETALEALRGFRERGWSVEGPGSPAHKPAYVWMTTDNLGYLWIYPHTRPEDEGRILDVFDPEGRYLGRVRSAFRLETHYRPIIRADQLYTVIRDSLGVSYVVRARINGRDLQTADLR
jgi:hypothetical protein